MSSPALRGSMLGGLQRASVQVALLTESWVMQLLLKLHECLCDVAISASTVQTPQRRALADQLSPRVRGPLMLLFLVDTLTCPKLFRRVCCLVGCPCMGEVVTGSLLRCLLWMPSRARSCPSLTLVLVDALACTELSKPCFWLRSFVIVLKRSAHLKEGAF